jgi:hypothetical protein
MTAFISERPKAKCLEGQSGFPGTEDEAAGGRSGDGAEEGFWLTTKAWDTAIRNWFCVNFFL